MSLTSAEFSLPATAKKTKKKDKNQRVEPESFSFGLKKEALKEAEHYDGHYLLRSNLSDKEPECLRKLYMLHPHLLGLRFFELFSKIVYYQ